MKKIIILKTMAAIIAAVYTMVNIYNHWSESGLIAVAVAMLIVQQVLNAAELAQTQKTAQESVERIIREIRLTRSVVYRGPGCEAAKEVFRRVSQLEEAENTYIGTVDTDYFSVSNYDIVGTYGRIAKTRGLMWTDVVCGPIGHYAERWRKISVPSMKATMSVHLQKERLPCVNFVILKYKNSEDREVWFGWGLTQQDRNASVFSSTDPLIVSYFRTLYASLKEDVPLVDIGTIRAVWNGGMPTRLACGRHTTSPTAAALATV